MVAAVLNMFPAESPPMIEGRADHRSSSSRQTGRTSADSLLPE
jgi:hypothetical protein